MKRFWLVLLSLGLIVAFSTSAMAVDVKFSGEYYAAGMYLDKTNVRSEGYWGSTVTNPTTRNLLPSPVTVPGYGTFTHVWATAPVVTPTYVRSGNSTAFYFQRLRLNTQFIVSPGLTLTTRADVMERAWGAPRSTPNAVQDSQSAGTTAENENIAFDLLYVTYVSPIGMFAAGYQIDGAWGTVFGNTSEMYGKVGYTFRQGPVTLGIQMGKNTNGELSSTAKRASNLTDNDISFYTAYGIYAWKSGQAGLLIKHIENRAGRQGSTWFPYVAALGGLTREMETDNKTRVTIAIPYVKAQLGPVALQAEVYYAYGRIKFEDTVDPAVLGAYDGEDEVDIRNLTAWIDATADFGMFYAGGSLAYVSGDDWASGDKREGGTLNGGLDWNPCLLMFNSDVSYWAGTQGGYDATANGGPMTNAFFAQIRGGVRPVDKLDIMMSFSWAKAERTPTKMWESREYGYEIDLTGTYKITNNLSYMLGAGYWFVGDYYQGTTDKNHDIEDNFLVLNKLTLTF